MTSFRARSGARSLLSAMLILSLTAASGMAVPAMAQEGHGAIHGVVYQADEKGKLAGAKVTVVNVKTGKQYVSEVTGNNGDYEISGLPAGTYDIVIESAGGAYVADNLVDLSQGQHLAVSYSVQPLRPANRRVAGLAAPKGSATAVGGGPGPGVASGSLAGKSFWARPGGIVLIAVLAGGTAAAIANNRSERNASPSAP